MNLSARLLESEPSMQPSDDPGPWGDASFHLSREQLDAGLAPLSPPKDRGSLALLVARRPGGVRETPQRAALSLEEGLAGDTWSTRPRCKPDAQLAVMRVDVARLLANGQPLSLFGDNLLVDLDLSRSNLPAGSRLRIGPALLEVTPEPHDGCRRFHQRFGAEALRFTADPALRELRLRGLYLKVIEPGTVSVGDAIDVLSRG